MMRDTASDDAQDSPEGGLPRPPARLVPARWETLEVTIDGYLERLTAAGATIQSLGGLPVVGESGRLALDCFGGRVTAQAVVTRVDTADRQFDVEVTRVDGG